MKDFIQPLHYKPDTTISIKILTIPSNCNPREIERISLYGKGIRPAYVALLVERNREAKGGRGKQTSQFAIPTKEHLSAYSSKNL